MKLFAFLLISVIGAGCHAGSKRSGGDEKIFPEFKVLLADSATYINTRDIPEGKQVVLIYFNPRCSYCRHQVAEITQHIEELKNIRFYIVANFPLSEMKRFIRESQASRYQNITIGFDPSNHLAGYFKTRRGPCMAIYGREKRLKLFFGSIL
jgi:thioredoxin-related protein